MSKRKKIRALHDALADSVLSLSEEQLSAEVKEEGLEPDAVAEETRAVLVGTGAFTCLPCLPKRIPQAARPPA